MDQFVENKIEEFPAESYSFRNNTENWIGFIGFKDLYPYLLISMRIDNPADFRQINDCKIIRIPGPSGLPGFQLSFTDQNGLSRVLELATNPEHEEFRNYTFLISGLLQNKVKFEEIYFILKQCNFQNGGLLSWKRGILRIIEKFLPKEFKDKENQICPSCGIGILKICDGCEVCITCGYSRS
jgi:hypothetical protein